MSLSCFRADTGNEERKRTRPDRLGRPWIKLTPRLAQRPFRDLRGLPAIIVRQLLFGELMIQRAKL